MGRPGPPSAPLLETVLEPTMVPAPKVLVLAACAIKAGKSKFMPVPASARPNGLPLRLTSKGRCKRPPSQDGPNSLGVTATGEKAEDGFDWKKPKPLPSSAGIRLRKEISLARTIRAIAAGASAT